MATIHVDTDTLRRLGQLFVQLNSEIRDNIGSQIQNLVSELENDWQGQSRARFDNLYNDWKSHSSNIVNSGEDLGRHLQNTATQLEQADQSL